MMRNPLLIGTRGSDLALWQANYVKKLLEDIGLAAELRIIKTQGDQVQHLSLDKLEGKGFFTKEIEEALLNEETDLAVHSFKDLPTVSAPGLIVAALSDREDPSELLLIRKECVDPGQKFSLKKNAVIGTSSARRKSQIQSFRQDVVLKDLRGNVPTRIDKLRQGQYDGILLAAAGVERLDLNMEEFHVEKLDPKEFIPAPAQGVLAIQVREKDNDLIRQLEALHHRETGEQVGIERKVLNLFQGGCQMPVGVFASFDEDAEIFQVRACIAPSFDKNPVSVYVESRTADGLAERVVNKIKSIKPCRVFISRELNKGSYLRNVLSGNGFQVEGSALIDTIPVPFNHVPDCEWIFFSSKQAVKFFFKQNPVIAGHKFACVGKSTADALRKFGQRAEFIGSSTDTKMTGKQFAARAGSSKVLFPQAKGSMQSIQQQFVKKEQVIDLVVYQTLKKNEGPQPQADILVFTSPSNVEAWFEKFSISAQQQVVALGDATAASLGQFGVLQCSKPDTFDEAGIARAVFGASSMKK